MSEARAIGRLGDWATGAGAPVARASAPQGSGMLESPHRPIAQSSSAQPPNRLTAQPPLCNRCHFPVSTRPWGCKNPCPNCGTVYPLGDCSD